MYKAIIFLPLLGAVTAGLFGRFIGDRPTEVITTSLLGITAFLSWIAFVVYLMGQPGTQIIPLLTWIQSGALQVAWSIRVDALTVIMLVVVNTVSFLVHLYSIGYMHEDKARPRFFAYLSLFTFAMLMLVTADNFVQMFFGWEGVGLASYLLIGFWYHKPSANAAAIKAFVVNRVGDFGFALGIFAAFWFLGDIRFDAAFDGIDALKGQTLNLIGIEFDILTVIALLLFTGAMGKSAQFLLHTWLPDAMEGPTPVSALIHAATMVTAGVFMVARLSPIFESSVVASNVVMIVGAVTAFFAATVGLVQNDIKRVIAYSTCSQLGYMFVALGVGAYSAGIYHLFTHAFFKALLFLGAGSVIHAMHHEQDMRNMGGLRKMIPVTYWTMILGTLALTGLGIPGIIGFAGFYSKDAIIESAFASGADPAQFTFWLLVIAALFTSFYSWRLIFMTFHGKSRASSDVLSHVHESPAVMTIPLCVLSIGAVFSGVVFYSYFFGKPIGVQEFFNGALVVDAQIIDAAHQVPTLVKWSATIVMFIGLLLALWFYIWRPKIPVALAQEHSGLYKFLLNKWYIDALYERIFVRPAQFIGRVFWRGVDDWLIDGFLVGGIASQIKAITARMVKLQSGYLYHYAFAMLVGVAALITWAMLNGGLGQ